MHDLFIVAIPTLTVLIGILLNRQDVTSLRAEINQLRVEFRTELRSEIGQLRSEIISLRDNIHRDMVGLHERLAVVEAKQKH